ncbi:MAG: hypothetical protein PVF07_06665, partial [Thiogranum sp.]
DRLALVAAAKVATLEIDTHPSNSVTRFRRAVREPLVSYWLAPGLPLFFKNLMAVSAVHYEDSGGSGDCQRVSPVAFLQPHRYCCHAGKL